MAKSFSEITTHITAGTKKLREAVPEAMNGFYAMSKGAMKPGVLSELDKELIALAIGVAQHCDGCIGFHTKALVRLGASREQRRRRLHGRRAVAHVRRGGRARFRGAHAREGGLR